MISKSIMARPCELNAMRVENEFTVENNSGVPESTPEPGHYEIDAYGPCAVPGLSLPGTAKFLK